ncbi:hypothetical protein CR205_16025 [Alteribacter lacisalsi]|uniref:SGNH/GDSL hydrolase family protein n=1 Tax=Alteribacter lacisalsi TaxID=2045244 RepID=A0A2W0HEZ6_9BACI|nr:SGNH/GDSL hydrolase family protein [Alteribacter lacisalsi]PYZ95885.1 hypothetical protein CR205_16025 [Alteribacter lacisalsi]
MKRRVVSLIVLVAIISVLAGKWQYDNRLSAIAADAHERLSGGETEASDSSASEENQETGDEDTAGQDGQNEAEEETAYDLTELADVPESVPSLFESQVAEAIEEERPVSILAFGSRALSDYDETGVTPWPELLQDGLADHYGEGLFEVSVHSHGNMSSSQVAAEGLHEEAAASGADIFLIEPFIWNDNGDWFIEDTIYNLERMLDAVIGENPEAVIALMPSQPRGMYQAPNYIANQIVPFGDYADESSHVYLNHWENWPSVESEELQDYLEGVLPSQAGHDAWSEYVLAWLTGENE